MTHPSLPLPRPRATTLARRSTVYAPRAAAATSHPLATTAALDVLAEGGNAVDAAVAAAAVLNVVEPHMTGIGGDVFALVRRAGDARVRGLRSIGRAGSGMSAAALRAHGFTAMPQTGAEAVTVPGSLAGWAALLQELGTLPLRDALSPAIRLAEEGFPVSPIIAEDWQAQEGKLRADAGARATYLVDGERAPRAGEWHRNPDLAATFRRVGEEGPGSLYGGELGRALVDGLAGLGGFLTLEDLAAHRAEWVDPIHASYRGYRIHQLPPPNQGIAALQMLRLLEPLEPGRLGHNSAEYIHLLTEVKKLAYADLAAHVADPEHMLTDAAALLSEEYLAGRRGMIDGARAASRVDPGHFSTRSDTVYLSVADGEGTMVSLINSIYSAFGSGIVIPGTGIALQNRGAGFRLEEGHPNSVAPGKRPFHTIIPAMVTRAGDAGEEAWLSYGVMGAAFQPQGQVQVLLNLVEFGMDLQEALDAPRFAHTEGVQITLEEPIGEGVRSALEALGHEIGEAGRLAYGGAQAVMRLAQGWAAASDPRKDGQAGGR